MNIDILHSNIATKNTAHIIHFMSKVLRRLPVEDSLIKESVQR